MSETTSTAVATPVKSTLPIKLTKEEEAQRYQFIGKCVDRGINFPSTAKFGVMGSMSVQDLCNSTIVTLAKIATSIKKEEAGHDPEFSGNEALKVAGIPATEWLTFFRLTIRKKNWNAYAADMRAQKRGLQAEIDAALTPEEKRKNAQEKLASLGEFNEED